MASTHTKRRRAKRNDNEFRTSKLKQTNDIDNDPGQSRDHGTPQVSAAARVFAIPELLEMILILHSRPSVDSSLLLYPLQRVNTKFATEIQKSPSLRRIMHRNAKEPGFIPFTPQFLIRLGFFLTEQKWDDRLGRFVNYYTVAGGFYGEEGVGWGLPLAWTAEKKATWKSLKVFRGNAVDVPALRLLFSEDEYSRWRALDIAPCQLTFLPQDEATLGDVYEGYRGVVAALARIWGRDGCTKATEDLSLLSSASFCSIAHSGVNKEEAELRSEN